MNSETIKNKEELTFNCCYCGYLFKQLVGTSTKASSQVRCPKCLNFLKTWGEKK